MVTTVPQNTRRPFAGIPRLRFLVFAGLLVAGCVPTVTGKPKIPAKDAVALFVETCVSTARTGRDFANALSTNGFASTGTATAPHKNYDVYGMVDLATDPATGAPYVACGVMGNTDTPAALENLLVNQINSTLGSGPMAKTRSHGPVTTYAVKIGGRPAEIAVNRQKAIGNFALFYKISSR